MRKKITANIRTLDDDVICSFYLQQVRYLLTRWYFLTPIATRDVNLYYKNPTNCNKDLRKLAT